MNIKKYLEVSGKTQSEFAAELGVTQGLVHQWIYGLTKVIAERCAAIEFATGGKVTKHDLRPDIFGPPKKRR